MAFNAADLLDLLASFGCIGNCGPADINADGQVNSGDLLDLLAAFGTICP